MRVPAILAISEKTLRRCVIPLILVLQKPLDLAFLQPRLLWDFLLLPSVGLPTKPMFAERRRILP
jgi:hypothetical protein